MPGGQEGIPKDYVEQVMVDANRLGNLEKDTLINTHTVDLFLRQHMTIYAAYSPFVVNPGRWSGPSDRKLEFITDALHLDKENGQDFIAREEDIPIIAAWTNVMLAANYYIWPTGESIRDYIVILCNAINFWDSGMAADQNQELLGVFKGWSLVLNEIWVFFLA